MALRILIPWVRWLADKVWASVVVGVYYFGCVGFKGVGIGLFCGFGNRDG
jgi:hypothetical protein